jgi:hydrogenase-4 membrane subunit HyfE
MNVKELVIVLVFAFVGWALCGATMGIGMAVTTEENALIIHAIGALIIFAVLSFIYFTKFNYTTPLQTAAIFVGFVIAVDFFVVALLIMNSFEMFTSPLGTWIPFALIFMATYLTGRYAQKRG